MVFWKQKFVLFFFIVFVKNEIVYFAIRINYFMSNQNLVFWLFLLFVVGFYRDRGQMRMS